MNCIQNRTDEDLLHAIKLKLGLETRRPIEARLVAAARDGRHGSTARRDPNRRIIRADQHDAWPPHAMGNMNRQTVQTDENVEVQNLIKKFPQRSRAQRSFGEHLTKYLTQALPFVRCPECDNLIVKPHER